VDSEEDDLMLLNAMSSISDSINDNANNAAQSNHVGETNGGIDDLFENDVCENSSVNSDSVNVLSTSENIDGRRLSSSSSSSVVTPVNGIKPVDHNAALLKLAVKLVKRPGKGK
jgi:hypothetical protein